MSDLGQTSLRGIDSNSLLRLNDQAFEIFTKSPSLQERTKAGRAIQRIAKELKRRKGLADQQTKGR
jgi:hypothetical protein